jgi:hypothetical protein
VWEGAAVTWPRAITTHRFGLWAVDGGLGNYAEWVVRRIGNEKRPSWKMGRLHVEGGPGFYRRRIGNE